MSATALIALLLMGLFFLFLWWGASKEIPDPAVAIRWIIRRGGLITIGSATIYRKSTGSYGLSISTPESFSDQCFAPEDMEMAIDEFMEFTELRRLHCSR